MTSDSPVNVGPARTAALLVMGEEVLFCSEHSLVPA